QQFKTSTYHIKLLLKLLLIFFSILMNNHMSNYEKHIASSSLTGKNNKIVLNLNQLTNPQYYLMLQLGIHVLKESILTHVFANFQINYILILTHALLLAKQFAKLTFGLFYGSNIVYLQIIY